MLSWPPPRLPTLTATFDWTSVLDGAAHGNADVVSDLSFNFEKARRFGVKEYTGYPFVLEFRTGYWLGKRVRLETDVSGVGHFGLAAVVQKCWNKLASSSDE